jgi:broad specificity phosphatase PhoE
MTDKIPARLWLVRHGQTDWNVEGRIQGHTPTDLNETGRQQAKDLAKHFSRKKFAAIWSSDLPRAASTANIIADRQGLDVHLTEALRERDLGEYAGKGWEELKILRQKASGGLPATGDLADWTAIPGVESDDDIWTRVHKVLHDISAKYDGQDVLVVTHGGVIARCVFKILGIPSGATRRFALSNGITAVVQWRHGSFYLLSFADMQLLLHDQPVVDTATVKHSPSA